MILIDFTALLKRLKRLVYHPATSNAGMVSGKLVLRVVNDMPVVDAVPVVRCKDCIHRGWELECPMCFDEWDENDIHTVDHTTDDGYCHCGEKEKDDEG